MVLKEFEVIFADQMKECNEVLIEKAKQYATADRLHNFKVAAALEGTTPMKALAGMMAKHTISIFDMCNSEAAYTQELWNEKITDHINYLILLKAIIADKDGQKDG